MKKSLGNSLFHSVNYLLFTVFCLLCLYPFYYILIYSLSDANEAGKSVMVLFPAKFTLENYLVMLKLRGIAQSFFISASRVVVGTALTLFFCSMFGYVIAKKELPFRRLMYRMTVISMYLNAGLIPWYITMKSYGLRNSFFLYILPFVISPFFVILVKTYIEQISPAMEESAIVDGAGYFTVYLRIILPVSVPIIAAVGVFSAVNQWNTWSDNFFLVSNANLQTLQYTLWLYLNQAERIAAQAMTDYKAIEKVKEFTLTPTTIRMTITMIVTIPIILVYPFLQRYFVKGIMLGAVKG